MSGFILSGKQVLENREIYVYTSQHYKVEITNYLKDDGAFDGITVDVSIVNDTDVRVFPISVHVNNDKEIYDTSILFTQLNVVGLAELPNIQQGIEVTRLSCKSILGLLKMHIFSKNGGGYT